VTKLAVSPNGIVFINFVAHPFVFRKEHPDSAVHVQTVMQLTFLSEGKLIDSKTAAAQDDENISSCTMATTH
jgi:hypothetical protein